MSESSCYSVQKTNNWLTFNSIKLIETYTDEDSYGQDTEPQHDTPKLLGTSPVVLAGQPEDNDDSSDWPEQKTVPHHVENEKYLSSEMFPTFKHMRQETLRVMPSKSGLPDDSLQSPRSPSLQQLALSDMRYQRTRNKEAYFQHLDQAFSKMTHSPPTNARGTRPFSVQGQPKFGASMCNPRCRCRCHSNRSVAHLSLSTFTNTLGAFSFSFTGPNSGTSACTESSCRARRARWLRITVSSFRIHS